MKNALTSKLAIGILGLAVIPAATQANLITGGIQIVGGAVTADDADLTQATQLSFNNTPGAGAAHVGSAVGSFSGSLNHYVTMYSPLVIRPDIQLPSTALWSVDQFSLTLTSLGIEGSEACSDNTSILLLAGDGVLSAAGFENTMGHWEAEFDSAGSGELVAFGWTASTDSTGTKAPDSVPDGGATAILLGSSLAIIGLFGRKQLTNV